MLGNIKSMYRNVRSRVKHNGCLGEPFSSNTGVRQGEYLSPFLCYMYLNDPETEQATKDLVGTNIGSINIYYVLYADDINLFAKKKKKTKKKKKNMRNCKALAILEEYYNSWKHV